MPNTITTTTPDGTTTQRPISPSWASVAPLLARWQIALLPQPGGAWNLVSGSPRACGLPVHGATGVAFAAVPQKIREVAARCEHEETSGGR